MDLMLANAGTVLIWVTMCGGIPGNVLIGGVEGWMIRRRDKVEGESLLAVCALANIASFLVGFVVLGWVLENAGWAQRMVVDAPRGLLWGSFWGLFVISVGVEWGIMRAVYGGKLRFGSCVRANVVTNAVFLPLIALASGNNLHEWDIKPMGEHPDVPGYRVSYVDRDGKRVEMDLGVVNEKLAKTGKAEPIGPGQMQDLRDVQEGFFLSDFGFVVMFSELKGHRGGKAVELQTEFPFARPRLRDKTVINGDLLVCGLGGYVVMIDPAERRIYRLAEGREVVVTKFKGTWWLPI